MRAAQLRRDFRFTYGEVFEATVRLYEDERLRRWRGEWKKFFTYEPGDGAEWEGTPVGSATRPAGSVLGVKYPRQAYIALIRTTQAAPGSSGSTATWAKMLSPDFTGSVLEFAAEGVFTHTPTVLSDGSIDLTVQPSQFASAPSSAPCHLKVTDGMGNSSYPVVGTALFRSP